MKKGIKLATLLLRLTFFMVELVLAFRFWLCGKGSLSSTSSITILIFCTKWRGSPLPSWAWSVQGNRVSRYWGAHSRSSGFSIIKRPPEAPSASDHCRYEDPASYQIISNRKLPLGRHWSEHKDSWCWWGKHHTHVAKYAFYPHKKYPQYCLKHYKNTLILIRGQGWSEMGNPLRVITGKSDTDRYR